MKRISKIDWYLKKNWWKYLLTIILSIIIIYCDILKPELIGQAVDLIGLGQITSKTLIFLLISLVVIVMVKFVVSIFKGICLGNLFHKLLFIKFRCFQMLTFDFICQPLRLQYLYCRAS